MSCEKMENRILGYVDGRLKGNEALPAKVTLMVGEVGVNVEIAGDIELE